MDRRRKSSNRSDHEPSTSYEPARQPMLANVDRTELLKITRKVRHRVEAVVPNVPVETGIDDPARISGLVHCTKGVSSKPLFSNDIRVNQDLTETKIIYTNEEEQPQEESRTVNARQSRSRSPRDDSRRREKRARREESSRQERDSSSSRTWFHSTPERRKRSRSRTHSPQHEHESDCPMSQSYHRRRSRTRSRSPRPRMSPTRCRSRSRERRYNYDERNYPGSSRDTFRRSMTPPRSRRRYSDRYYRSPEPKRHRTLSPSEHEPDCPMYRPPRRRRRSYTPPSRSDERRSRRSDCDYR